MEWVGFDTLGNPEYHHERVRYEAMGVLEKIATDPESQLRTGLLGLQSRLPKGTDLPQDATITIWAANKLGEAADKLGDVHRREAIAALRDEFDRWVRWEQVLNQRGENFDLKSSIVYGSLSTALEKLESA